MMAQMDRTFLERHSTKLSLAVFILDDYTGKNAIGRVNVSLKGQEEKPVKPVKNPSSYYLFLNLPNNTYTVHVHSDNYFDKNSDIINLAELDPKNPVVNITVKPTPSYPFPHGTTLIRGMVCDLTGNAVPDARIDVREKGVWNRTNEKGEFALYFGSLTEDEIIKEDGKRFVKGNGGKIIRLEVKYKDVAIMRGLEIEEGKTTSVRIEG